MHQQQNEYYVITIISNRLIQKFCKVSVKRYRTFQFIYNCDEKVIKESFDKKQRL